MLMLSWPRFPFAGLVYGERFRVQQVENPRQAGHARDHTRGHTKPTEHITCDRQYPIRHDERPLARALARPPAPIPGFAKCAIHGPKVQRGSLWIGLSRDWQRLAANSERLPLLSICRKH
jgi:hypothetical protein